MLQGEAYPDPYLELLRLGAESEHIESAVTVTLLLDGALVTGTVVSTDTWERLHLGQLRGQDGDLYRTVREAIWHLDDAAEKGRRRRQQDRRFLHLRDVTYRSGRTTHTLPAWRGPVTAISGWTLGHPA
ncbi:hypothetical protein [Kitasatospora sp. NPDC092286]|uniref:hypothetical protein n=1 Tax=Kitasatospora sp. NPDC092286 TaxID=3364087 RepID=UPI0038252749